MTPDTLERECRVYCRYLIGLEATDYLVRKYAEGHAAGRFGAATRFDEILLWVSRTGRLGAMLADSYASRFRPAAPLRSKLVLTLALLECAPEFYRRLDAPSAGTPAGALVRMAAGGLVYVLALAIGVVLLGPVHLACALERRRSA